MEKLNTLNEALLMHAIVKIEKGARKDFFFIKKAKSALFKLNVYHWFDGFSDLKISLEEMEVSKKRKDLDKN